MRYSFPDEAAGVLREGGVVLVPTETVVGIVAEEAGVLNRIKGSDPGKPIALLCASAQEAFDLAAQAPPLARKLAELYWPGPLTLVLNARGGGTVGVRVPAGAVAEVLRAYGRPFYATSANPSGGPTPRSLEEVDPTVLSSVDRVVEGEPGNGEASAVVDLSQDQVRLLRSSGQVTEDTLTRLTNS